MSKYVLSDCGVYVAEYDLSGDHNAISLTESGAVLDATTFGCSTRVNAGGLSDIALTGEGYWESGSGDLDAALNDVLMVHDELITIAPQTTDAGDAAKFFKSLTSTYTPMTGSVGELLKFNIGASGRSVLANGNILANEKVTVTGNGTAYELGAVGAAEYLYGGVHVTAFDGTSIGLTIESDDNESFTSATTRITFTIASDVTAEWATPVSGAITDTWWRATWTVVGTSMDVVFVMAIQ